MANTNLLKKKTKNPYGITPEKREAARQELERIIEEQNVRPARTVEDLYGHSVADDDGEEIDEFMRLREEWRREDGERSFH